MSYHFDGCIPDQGRLESWNNIADARGWAKITDVEWQKLVVAAGDPEFNGTYVLARLSDEDFAQARTESGLPILRRAAVNLLCGAVKYKFNVVTSFLKLEAPTAATVRAATGKASTTKVGGDTVTTTTLATTVDIANLAAKVKLGQVLGQSLDQDVPMLAPEITHEIRMRCI